MPSPVGHALGGIAAGWLVCGAPPPQRAPMVREAALFGSIGILPDLDLLFGAHSGPTHGVGAAVAAGLLALVMVRRLVPRSAALFALACAAAYASHILLDWLGSDTSAPIGIMALWPFNRQYLESDLHVFMAVSRRYWAPGLFWQQNLAALARELLILTPIVAIVAVLRKRRA